MPVRSSAPRWVLCACALLATAGVHAEEAPGTDPGCDIGGADNCAVSPSPAVALVGGYVTAPLHWDRDEWLAAGAAAAAVIVAHAADTSVRNHFAPGPAKLTKSTYALQDAAPALIALAGTFGYAAVIRDHQGLRESWTMLEAAGSATVTTYVLKFAAGRERPDQSTDPNKWRSGGGSFPSEHSAAAFGIGTVLAESGSDEYRWIRRVLGYGIGTFTVYERLKHNQHWLSDTVAGSAVGIASARYMMDFNEHRDRKVAFGVEPVPGGVLLSVNRVFQ